MAGKVSPVYEGGDFPIEVYQPLFSAPENICLFEPDEDPRRYELAIAAGKMIVAQEYAEMLSRNPAVEVLTEKRIERRRSAHGVTYGVTSADALEGEGPRRELPVALKPFGSYDTAVNELKGYHDLHNLKIPTFIPIGLFPAQDPDYAVCMTVKNDYLRSLDRYEWIVGRAPTSERTYSIAKINDEYIRGIADLMAYMHANGIFHPDGQLKNWAVTASDKIGAIDTENLITGKINSYDAGQLAQNDIEKLLRSLIFNSHNDDEKIFGVGMLANLSLNTVRSSIIDLILKPYEARLERELQANPHRLEHIMVLNEGVIERFNAQSEKSWPGHLVEASKR